jgi:hypothetical protein
VGRQPGIRGDRCLHDISIHTPPGEEGGATTTARTLWDPRVWPRSNAGGQKWRWAGVEGTAVVGACDQVTTTMMMMMMTTMMMMMMTMMMMMMMMIGAPAVPSRTPPAPLPSSPAAGRRSRLRGRPHALSAILICHEAVGHGRPVGTGGRPRRWWAGRVVEGTKNGLTPQLAQLRHAGGGEASTADGTHEDVGGATHSCLLMKLRQAGPHGHTPQADRQTDRVRAG